MKQRAIISLSSKQSINEEEVIEVVTPGDFYKKENYYYAVYEETQLSGMSGTTTTLKIGKDKFSLIRMGSTNAKMDFDKKTKNISMYSTPYGTLELKIETKYLDIDIDDDGGNVRVSYNMSLSGQTPYSTMLKINIKTHE